MNTSKSSRRDFLKLTTATSVLAGTSTTLLSRPRVIGQQSISANDRIQIALIGAGGQGHYDTQEALKVPGVELVAAADVYDGRLIHVKERFGSHVSTTRDYR